MQDNEKLEHFLLDSEQVKALYFQHSYSLWEGHKFKREEKQ